MPKSPDAMAMQKVLSQIAQLCRQFDGDSLKGMKEPEQMPEPDGDEGNPMMEGGDPEGDAAKLMALKRQEDEER